MVNSRVPATTPKSKQPAKKEAVKKQVAATAEPPKSSKPYKKLSPELMEALWTIPGFQLPTTKFVLFKLLVSARTNVRSMKDLVVERTGIRVTAMGGFQFVERLSCWAFLANSKEAASDKFRSSEVIGHWSMAEVLENKADFVALAKMKCDEMKKHNRPLFIALSLLEKGLKDGNSLPSSLLGEAAEAKVEKLEVEEYE